MINDECISHVLNIHLESKLSVQDYPSVSCLSSRMEANWGHTVCNGGQPCSPPIVTYHCKNLSVREVFFYCCKTSFMCKEELTQS